MVQGECNKVKSHCKVSLSRLLCLAAGAIWQEWVSGENLAKGWFYMDLAELFKILS